MRKCKRAGFDLEKIEDVEEEMEEEKRLKKKKKKSREMEEGPGRPQQILLGLLWLGAGGVAVMRLLQEQVLFFVPDEGRLIWCSLSEWASSCFKCAKIAISAC